MITPLYIASGFAVGFIVGMTGVGGGSLMTPLLVLLFGFHPAAAVGTDLLFAAITKSGGTVMHGISRSIAWRVVALLALGSVPATIATLAALHHYDVRSGAVSSLISAVLGVALLLTALSLVFRRSILRLAQAVSFQARPRQQAIVTVLTGAVLGCFVSISSVGAGALGVTVLLLLYPNLRVVQIVGTDIAHAVPLTLVAGLGHWMLGTVDGPVLLWLVVGSLPGIVLGSFLAPRMPDPVLRPILAAVLAVVGLRLVLA